MNGCWIKGTSKKEREWEYIKTNEFLNLFLFLGMDIGYNEIQPFFLLASITYTRSIACDYNNVCAYILYVFYSLKK